MSYGEINTPGASYLETQRQIGEMAARVENLESTISGKEKIPGDHDPTKDTVAEVGQIYINTVTKQEWICIAVTEEGTVWKEREETAPLTESVPQDRTINGKPLTTDITLTYTDVGAVPKDRKINGKPLTEDITLTHADVGAVPKERAINGKPLTENIVLKANDVGARPADWTPTAEEVGARPAGWTPTADDVGAVPRGRKVNGKPLTTDITLTAADVGAAAAGHTHTFFVAQASAPSDTKVLWIDTSGGGGLKYHNGSAWVPVPVAYT